jgi:hypothetical protein
VIRKEIEQQRKIPKRKILETVEKLKGKRLNLKEMKIAKS